MIDRATYQSSVSARSRGGFRGVRTGMGPHYERDGWTRFQVNFDSQEQTLDTRAGHTKRYIVDGGYINNVMVEEDTRLTALNGEIHMATITAVPAPTYTKDEADAKFVPYGDFNTSANIQHITDPPVGFTAGFYIEDADNLGTWHKMFATSQYGAIQFAIETTGTTLP